MTHTDTHTRRKTALQRLKLGTLAILIAIIGYTYTAFGTMGLLTLAAFAVAIPVVCILSWFVVSILRAAGWTLIGCIIVLNDVFSDRPTDWTGHADAWLKGMTNSFLNW